MKIPLAALRGFCERLQKISGDQLARYPERTPIEAIVAAHLKIQPEELLLTNGTDEAIHLICETYLEPETEALIVVPTYSMYEIYAAATGCQRDLDSGGRRFSLPVGTDFLARSATALV